MEVILLDKVHGLGSLGDKVSVAPGFGRNYLVPFGKAVFATKENLAEFEQRRAELEKKAQERLAEAEKRSAALNEHVVNISAKASDEGKLYGSIGTRDIARAISDSGHEVCKSEVMLPQGPLRAVGEYDITLQLHGDVTALVKITVAAAAE